MAALRSLRRGVVELVFFPEVEGIVLPSSKREMEKSSRNGAGLQAAKSREEDLPLVLPVERLPALVPERVIDKDSARRFDEHRDVQRRRERHRGDPRLLDGSGHQSHGLMTELSDGNEERGVHIQEPEALHDPGRHLFLKLCALEDPPHEGERNGGEGTDKSFGSQLSEPLQGKDGVEVLHSLCVLRVVGNPKIARGSVNRDLAPGKVVLH
jgi:hypothetical protein